MLEWQWSFSFAFYLCLLCSLCAGYDFDQNFFGVTFMPYVKQPVDGVVPKFNNYTFENIETMLKIVSRKFSHIAVVDNFAFSGQNPYIRNLTYYKHSFISVRAAEAAAKINRDNGNKSLSVLIVLDKGDSVNEFETNVLLSLEAAEKANSIFPRTVEGIFFPDYRDLNGLTQILNHLNSIKTIASLLDVKLGVHLNSVDSLNDASDPKSSIIRKMIQKSDLVMWAFSVRKSAGPVHDFDVIVDDMLQFRQDIWKINRDAKVIGWTDYSRSGSKEWDTVGNFKIFWETADKWAYTHNYTIYLDEAFDNPWKNGSKNDPNAGWWRLTDNSKINLVEGYVEKVSEAKNKNEKSTIWKVNGTVICVIVFMVLIVIATACTVYSYSRGKRPTVLSPNEIQDFISGSDQKNLEREGHNTTPLETVMNAPYDKSLEISKNRLKIDHNQLLGTGEFGCVFKAVLKLDNGSSIQVAVKTMKDQSPSSALKGLLSEIKIMSYLGAHPNLVGLVGAYTAEIGQGVVYVATEFCGLGSLVSFLRSNQSVGETKYGTMENNQGLQQMEMQSNAKITFYDMIRWSHEIACGMEYLENKHVVHSDLACRNVLLTAENTAKISDFGLSRRMYNYMNYVKTHQEPLPWRWMAIETMKTMEFSSKSDVWSYGVTMWEIFSKGDTPYPGLSWTQDFVNELLRGLRLDCPMFASPDIYKVMQDCWNVEPKERPNFSQLVVATSNLLQQCARTDDRSE